MSPAYLTWVWSLAAGYPSLSQSRGVCSSITASRNLWSVIAALICSLLPFVLCWQFALRFLLWKLNWINKYCDKYCSCLHHPAMDRLSGFQMRHWEHPGKPLDCMPSAESRNTSTRIPSRSAIEFTDAKKYRADHPCCQPLLVIYSPRTTVGHANKPITNVPIVA